MLASALSLLAEEILAAFIGRAAAGHLQVLHVQNVLLQRLQLQLGQWPHGLEEQQSQIIIRSSKEQNRVFQNALNRKYLQVFGDGVVRPMSDYHDAIGLTDHLMSHLHLSSVPVSDPRPHQGQTQLGVIRGIQLPVWWGCKALVKSQSDFWKHLFTLLKEKSGYIQNPNLWKYFYYILFNTL